MGGYFEQLYLQAAVALIRAGFKWHVGEVITSPDDVLQIPSRDPGRTIRAHVYTPPEATASGKRPVLINFHGSGFILPYHGSDEAFCRTISSKTAYTVLDVQYSLAPERPWPKCHEDAEDVVNWVLSQPERFVLDRLAVSGFSAGGNIAIVAAATTFPKHIFRTLIAVYPPTDLLADPGSKVAPDTSGSPIPAWQARLFNQAYLQNATDAASPSVSPSFADPARFPGKTFIATAGLDSLCLEAEALGERIKETGASDVTLYRAEKCNHAWDKSAAEGSVQAEQRDKVYSIAVSILNDGS